MIRSFKDKEAERIFGRQWSRKLPDDLQRTALRKLRMLNRAMTLSDLRVPPENRLEKLSPSIHKYDNVFMNRSAQRRQNRPIFDTHQ